MSRRLRIMILATFIVGMATWATRAQTPTRKEIDVSKLGPQVGEQVPDFRLKDQHGNDRTLQSIMGSKGAMLVFVRSAEW